MASTSDENIFFLTFIHLYQYKSRSVYHIYPVYSDRQTCANSVETDQTPRSAASDQALHCLPLDLESRLEAEFSPGLNGAYYT